jgi:hypothetical protein
VAGFRPTQESPVAQLTLVVQSAPFGKLEAVTAQATLPTEAQLAVHTANVGMPTIEDLNAGAHASAHLAAIPADPPEQPALHTPCK